MSVRKELAQVVSRAMNDDGYMGTITIVNRLVGWLGQHDRRLANEYYELGWTNGFAAQGEFEEALRRDRESRDYEPAAPGHPEAVGGLENCRCAACLEAGGRRPSGRAKKKATCPCNGCQYVRSLDFLR